MNCDEQPEQKSASLSVGQSLIRIHDGLEEVTQHEMAVEDAFQTWQQRWSRHREQMARRLELIDAQLDSLARSANFPPQLSIVRLPAESRESA